jgi:hypothetical protein
MRARNHSKPVLLVEVFDAALAIIFRFSFQKMGYLIIAREDRT